MTINQSTNKVTLFIDGAVSASGSIAAIDDQYCVTTKLVSEIGRITYDSATYPDINYMNTGTLDEMRIYNRALTTGEMQKLYASVAGTYPSGECNDQSMSINPGQKEICGDGIDNNCDGLIDVRADGVTCTICDHYQLTVPVVECNALVDLYTATNGPTWTSNTGWLTTPDVEQWFGITLVNTGGANHVQKLCLGDESEVDSCQYQANGNNLS